MSDPDTLPGVDAEPTLPDGKTKLPYVSKSRIKTFLQCPRKFYWKYWCEERPPGTYHTVKGSEIHEVFEDFHEVVIDHIDETDEFPDRFTPLLDDWENYAQWVEYVGEFFRFELRRWEATYESIVRERGFPQSNTEAEQRLLAAVDRWEPVAVEAEAWLGAPPESWIADNDMADVRATGEPPVGDIPWMGRADLIVKTKSLPDIDGDGVTIIDYKTGTAPTVKYAGKPWLEESLQEGIFLEGEYYGWLFEQYYDVDAVAGYYPKNDELITAPYPSEDRRADITAAVLGMQQEPDIENFDIDQSPLCHWDNANGEGQCWFHPVCPVTANCDKCPNGQTPTEGRYDQ